jgi:hypothetical protein
MAITVRNMTTAQEFTIAGTVEVTGTVEIDCLEGTGHREGSDVMHLFDGEFLELALGLNTIHVSWTEPGPTYVAVLHRDQWW